MDLARNTVRAALRAEVPPSRERPPRGSVADVYEPAIRAVLLRFPRMPATVIAERIGWPYSITPLKRKLRSIRPEYVGVDPADRLSFALRALSDYDAMFGVSFDPPHPPSTTDQEGTTS